MQGMGRGGGKTTAMLRAAYEQAKDGNRAVVCSPERDVAVLPAKELRELDAAKAERDRLRAALESIVDMRSLKDPWDIALAALAEVDGKKE